MNNKQKSKSLNTATLVALGIVFGDIGTSPLYALRECFTGSHGVALTSENIFGVLSLIFWSLILIISIKYLSVVMHASNHGEGGILALMGLTKPDQNIKSAWSRNIFITVGLFGAALLYGDSVITPVITVLSAIEGLKVGNPWFEPYVIPVTLCLLYEE
jgi:KUP system potassium uptake protein